MEFFEKSGTKGIVVTKYMMKKKGDYVYIGVAVFVDRLMRLLFITMKVFSIADSLL